MSTKLLNDIRRIRDDINATKERIDALEWMCVPVESAMVHIDSLIASCAERARFSPSPAMHGQAISPPRSQVCAFDLLCWIAPDKVRVALERDLFEYANGRDVMEPGLTAQEKARLESRLFELEVQEERLIVQAEGAGVSVHRRGDANPRAVLEA